MASCKVQVGAVLFIRGRAILGAQTSPKVVGGASGGCGLKTGVGRSQQRLRVAQIAPLQQHQRLEVRCVRKHVVQLPAAQFEGGQQGQITAQAV